MGLSQSSAILIIIKQIANQTLEKKSTLVIRKLAINWKGGLRTRENSKSTSENQQVQTMYCVMSRLLPRPHWYKASTLLSWNRVSINNKIKMLKIIIIMNHFLIVAFLGQ